jgi:hypothetical protein
MIPSPAMDMLATPIGAIPKDYKYFGVLLKKAYLNRYVRTRPDKTTYDDWAIVSEPTNGHQKFCMILDLIEFKARQVMRHTSPPIEGKLLPNNVLNCAIGVDKHIILPDGSTIPFEVKKYETMPYRQLRNELARMGHSSYSEVKDLDTFDL